jgi:transcriptional regulator with XRE-family HTH domain
MTTTVHQRKVPNRRLQELRINQGLSINDLAVATKVSAASLRLYERGYVPGPRNQFAIASYFGSTPLDIWPLSTQRVPA